MIRRIPCTICRTSGSTPVNFLLQCSCGISLHHKCVIPAISQEVLMSMVEASTNDCHANSLQTWQCPNCKVFEASAKTNKIFQSRFQTFVLSSNDQIDEAYRHMLLKRPIDSVYDHVHGITAACVNKKSKGAHARVKAAPKGAKKVKYLATTRNPEPPSTDPHREILKTSPRSRDNNYIPAEFREATIDCRRPVKSSAKLLPAIGNKQEKYVSDLPPMNTAMSVQPQLEINNTHLRKSTDNHEARPPTTAEGNANEMVKLNHDKAKEPSLPPLLDLTKFLNTKLSPKRRHNTFQPTFSDQDAPPAKRRRLVYHTPTPDAQTDDKRPNNDDTTSLLLAANDNDDLIPVKSLSLSQQLESQGSSIVPPNNDTAEETSVSLHVPPGQQQSVVELQESSHRKGAIAARPLLLRTPSPTPTCYPTAIVTSPAIIPTALIPSSTNKAFKLGHQDKPIRNAPLDGAKEGAASLKDDIAESSNVKHSTPGTRPSHSQKASTNTTDQERLMEDPAVYVYSDVRTEVEDRDGALSISGPKFAIPDLSTESVPDNVPSKMIDEHSRAADSILEVDQGSKDVTEIEAQDTPTILLQSINNCELEKNDTQHVESSFADGLLSPPPTDDETQFVVALQSPSKPDVAHNPNVPDCNLKNTSDAVDQGNEIPSVEKVEVLNSLDNIIKRLPQPKATSSFKLSTVTVPGLAKCFKSFGLSRRAY